MSMQDDEILGKAYDSRLMKRLLRYAQPYRYHIIGGILLTIFISALGPIRPYLTKVAVDEAIANGDKEYLLTLALVLVGTLVLQGIVQFVVTYLTQWIGQRTILDIRMEVFRKLQSMGMRFYDRNPVGRLVTRVTGDVEVLNEMFSAGVVTVFADVFIILWIIGFMFFIDWQLALVTLSVLPLLVYATFLFRKKVRETYRDIRFHVARLNSFTQERVSGMATVQLYGREESEYRKHDEINSMHANAHIKSVFFYAVFFPMVEFLSALAIALIVWYAGGQIISGMMSLGVLISFIQYTEMFFRPIRDLSEKYNIMQTAMASSERLFQLLDDQTVIPELSKERAKRYVPGDIEFRNVWFSYNAEEYVLRDVSFKIPRGTSSAIVGATGAGKTTIINLLSRFYDIQKGEILIGGVDIREMPLDELRKHIAVVLQDVFLFSGDIRQNIGLGRKDISDEALWNTTRMVGADGFIGRLEDGLNSEVKERGATLSVGQKQLLAFARALAYDPEILVLDEATSSVDTETERLIQQAIENLMRERTSIVIAHRLSTIQHADQIIVMHKGQVRESGTHAELLRKDGIYSRLYQLQYKEQELQQV